MLELYFMFRVIKALYHRFKSKPAARPSPGNFRSQPFCEIGLVQIRD